MSPKANDYMFALDKQNPCLCVLSQLLQEIQLLVHYSAVQQDVSEYLDFRKKSQSHLRSTIQNNFSLDFLLQNISVSWKKLASVWLNCKRCDIEL